MVETRTELLELKLPSCNNILKRLLIKTVGESVVPK